MRLYFKRDAIGSVLSDGRRWSPVNGGAGWSAFFAALIGGKTADLNTLIVLRLDAEQGGVDYAVSLPGSKALLAAADRRTQFEMELFLWGADQYRLRASQCRQAFSCPFPETDPRFATDTWVGDLGQLPGPVSALYPLQDLSRWLGLP